MEKVSIDDRWEISENSRNIPTVLTVRSLQPEQNVEVELPYIAEHGGIRPAEKGETPTGFLRFEINVTFYGFTATIHNSRDNPLNTIRGSGCSLRVKHNKHGSWVEALDGIGDWRKFIVLSQDSRGEARREGPGNVITG